MDEEHNKARESCYKKSLSPDVGASHVQLQPTAGIFLQPSGVNHSHRVCTEASFISCQLGTMNTKTLAASMPVFDFVYHCPLL